MEGVAAEIQTALENLHDQFKRGATALVSFANQLNVAPAQVVSSS
jgi:hypothetical protein